MLKISYADCLGLSLVERNLLLKCASQPKSPKFIKTQFSV